jgi:hypothetical protein
MPIIKSIQQCLSVFREKQAARKKQHDNEHRQVQALMDQNGWGYHRAFAVFLNSNGHWDCD